jgi:hypothetical protein
MNTKIYPIALIIMVLINGLLLFKLLVHSPQKHMPRPEAPTLMEHISKKLKLNSNQEEKYSELAKNHGAAFAELEQQERKLIHTYFNFLNDDVPNLEDQKLVLDQLKTIETKKIQMTYAHFEQLKLMCSDTQLIHFVGIMKEIINVLTKKSGERPPRRRD